MKKTKIIVPAMALLALGTAASVTGTVAWFSLNTSVSLTGMTVHTQVSSNLMIANGAAGTTSVGDANFSSSAVNAIGDKILEPVSTVNGVDFFYTVNGKADGDATTDDYVAYNESAFQTAYGVPTAVGYVDYIFELKAVNADQSNAKYIDLSKVDIVYTGASTDESKAFRFATFIQEGTYDGSGALTGYNALGSSATCIMDMTGSLNQTADYAVSAAGTAPTAISIMANSSLTSMQVPARTTKYFKVTQRLYLEGEDKTCTNETFLPLTDAWNIYIKYDLQASNSGSLTEISKFAAQSVNLNSTATALYKDGAGDLYSVATGLKINNGSVIPEATLTAEELTALNSAFSTSFTRG